MLKKLVLLLLVVAFLAAFVGCGSSENSNLDPDAKKAADDVIAAVKEKVEYEAKLIAIKAKEALATTTAKKQEYAKQAKEYQEKIDELKTTISTLQAKFDKFKDILSPAQWMEIYNYFTSQYKKVLGG